MSRRRATLTSLAAVALVCGTFATARAELPSSLEVKLIPDGGEPVSIGTVALNPNGDGYDYSIAIESDRLEDKFLSMRPFKCLNGPHNMVCHLAYGYEIRRHITADDLTDLEYDLLFLHKTPAEYGINAWNGLYYKLAMGNGGFEGTLHEVDLNILAAPPEDGNLRPIVETDLHEAEEGRHSYPRLVIE